MENISRIMPLIIPKSYCIENIFPSPFKLLKHSELALTWVSLTDNQMMLYLTKESAVKLNEERIMLEEIAMKNLRDNSENLYTHERRDENGDIIYIVMMHNDGLGSSRLLLQEELQEIFPDGYEIAIPERSVGLAFPKQLKPEAYNIVKELVQKCYNVGNTPMLGEILSPDEIEKVGS